MEVVEAPPRLSVNLLFAQAVDLAVVGLHDLVMSEQTNHRRRRRALEDRKDLPLEGGETLDSGVEIIIRYEVRHATRGDTEVRSDQ